MVHDFCGFIIYFINFLSLLQVNIELPSPILSDINNCRIVHNGCGSVKDEWKGGLPNETSSVDL